MRTFTERDPRSPFLGENIIYDSVEEFKKEKGEEFPLKKWGVGEISELQAGEWVIADDGYVVQVLRVKTYLHQKGYLTYFVRVPMGTFAVYYTKSRGYVWRQMFAQFGSAQKSSINHRSRLYSPGVVNKIKFATLLLSGMSVIKIMKIVHPHWCHLTNNQLLSKAVNFMDDKIVQKEIRSQVAVFQDSFDKKFSDERIVKELDMLLDLSEKGSAAHRGNIQFIMELKGLITPTSKKSGKKFEGAEDADYDEVPPSEG